MTAVFAVAMFLVASAQPVFADGPSVSPVLECVFKVDGGNYVAVFGYNNTGTKGTIPIGDANSFSPAPQDRGQGTSFDGGRHISTFKVTFTGDLTWILSGQKVTAGAAATPCSNSSVPIGTGSQQALFWIALATGAAVLCTGGGRAVRRRNRRVRV